MATPDACPPFAADGVQLVDEDDAGSVPSGVLKEASHPACPHAHEHLHELAGGDGEEGDTCFPRHRPGQKGLAGSGRAHQENSFGDFRAQLQVLLGVLEEVHHLHEFPLGFLVAGHVLEGGVDLLFLPVKLGPALPELHHLPGPALGPHEEEPEEDDEEEGGSQVEEELGPKGGRFGDDPHPVFLQEAEKLGVGHLGWGQGHGEAPGHLASPLRGGEALGFLQGAQDAGFLQGHLRHFALAHQGAELRVGKGGGWGAREGGIGQIA
ncbi:hypothetical protein HRbin38_00416 [bacterium HR38]|nr:hypothetical protein HRbin38_00416 [bacterium HR38]